jgi:hypothetical protein
VLLLSLFLWNHKWLHKIDAKRVKSGASEGWRFRILHGLRISLTKSAEVLRGILFMWIGKGDVSQMY